MDWLKLDLVNIVNYCLASLHIRKRQSHESLGWKGLQTLTAPPQATAASPLTNSDPPTPRLSRDSGFAAMNFASAGQQDHQLRRLLFSLHGRRRNGREEGSSSTKREA